MQKSKKIKKFFMGLGWGGSPGCDLVADPRGYSTFFMKNLGGDLGGVDQGPHTQFFKLPPNKKGPNLSC